MPARHLLITGIVQGVFFRAETRKKAQELSLAGWVRNLADGSVEAHAQGPDDALDQLEQWCRRGPPRARVDDLVVTPAEETTSDVFEIL